MLSQTNQQRALIALVEVLGLSVWFSATAVAPSLRSEWGIGASAAVWLTASVQVGFVAGAVTSTVLNLAGGNYGTRLDGTAVAQVAAVGPTGITEFVGRGLHFDGVADTADGFGGGRTREDVLRIMRVHAIGAYGAIALAKAAGLLVLRASPVLGELRALDTALRAATTSDESTVLQWRRRAARAEATIRLSFVALTLASTALWAFVLPR